MRRTARFLSAALAAVVLFAARSALAGTPPAVPYFPVFSPNTGEIVRPVDDKAIEADLIRGDLRLSFPALVHFRSASDTNLMFGLFYSSGNGAGGSAGAGWSCTYDIKLAYSWNNGSPTMNLLDVFGRSLPFVQGASGWVSAASFGCHLTATVSGSPSSPTGFTVSDRWGRTITFDSAGRPLSISDFFGRTITLSWTNGLLTGVADPFNRSITLVWSNGLLSSVLDNTAQGSPAFVRLYYDGANRLSSFVTGYPGGTTATYAFNYSSGILLATYTDPDGGVWSFSFTSGLLTGITDPLNAALTIGYGTGSATLTDRTGATWNYYFNTAVNALSRLDYPPLNGNVFSLTQSFDSSRNMTSRAEPGKAQWNMTYDSNGNLLSRSATVSSGGSPQTITYSWSYNASNLPVTYTDPNGNVWRFSWAGPGRLSGIIQPDDNPAAPTHAAAITYSASGFPATFRDYRGNVWSFAWSGGLLASVTTPLGAVWGRTWTAWGLPATETDPLGAVTSYAYDNMNRLVSISRPFDATGPAVTSMTLTAAGRLSSRTDPTGATWSYTRDAAGRLTVETDPLSNSRSFAYDAEGRLTAFTDFRGNRWNYSLDAWGRPVSLTDPLGNTRTWTYNVSARTVTEADRTGVTIVKAWDGAGRLVSVTDAANNVLSWLYDAAGNVVAEIDRRGNATTFSYDPLNRLTGRTDPLGFTYTLAYDPNGNLTSTVNRANGRTTRLYDAENRLVSLTGVDGATYTYDYDAAGRIVTITNPRNGVYSHTYNAGGLLVSYSDPMGNTVSYTWDRCGRLLSEADLISVRRTITRDALGRVTAVAYPDGTSKNYGYDPDGNMVSYSDCNGNVWTYAYDAVSNVTALVNPLGGNTTLSYDAEGRLTGRVDPAGVSYQWGYDSRGLLASFGVPPSAFFYGYDADGNVTSITDPLGNTKTLRWNARNELVSVTDPLGNTTNYTYDAEGYPASVTDPRGNTTLYVYDAAGNLVSMTDPAGNTETRTWSDRLLMSRTDRNGRTTSYAYDAAGRLVSETFFDPWNPSVSRTRTFGYDVRGNCTAENGPYLSLSRTFDSRDRVKREEWNPTGFSGGPLAIDYTWDGNGNVLSVTDFAGRVIRYTYNALDRVVEINDGGRVSTMSYDLAGRITSRVLPSGQYEQWTYAGGSNLATAYDVFNSSGVRQEGLSYSYDAAWNLVSKSSIRGWSVSYAYDALNRLTAETRTGSGAYTRSYSYDAAGNLASLTVNGTTTTYVYDNRNCLTSETTGSTTITYSYDANGNRTADSTGRTWTYDHRDRLAGYTNGTSSWRYWNIYDDVRICKEYYQGGALQQRDYIFCDEFEPSCVYRVSGTSAPVLVEQYCYADDVGLHALTIPPGQPSAGYYPYLTDEEGNIIGVVDSTQTWRNLYEYTAFGTVITAGGSNPVPNIYRYKRAILDSESGLYNVFRRAFDPSVRRYVQGGLPGTERETDYAFLQGRPAVLFPYDGETEGYVQLTPDVKPATALFERPVEYRPVFPAVLASPLLQWRTPFPLYDTGKCAKRFRNVGRIPTTRAELEAAYAEILNRRFVLQRWEEPEPSFAEPVPPLGVEEGDFEERNDSPLDF